MSTKDIYLGLTFKDAFTKDYLVPKQWLMTGFGAGTNMKQFNTTWWDFKRKYRDRFMYDNLKKKIPNWITSTAQIMVVKEPELTAWLQSKYPGFTSFSGASISIPWITDIVEEFLFRTYGSKYKGNGTIIDNTNANEVITYKVKDSGFDSLYGSNKPNNPNIVNGRVNTKKFSVTMVGHAVDSNGDVIYPCSPDTDSSGNVIIPKTYQCSPKEYTKEHKAENNTHTKESMILYFKVNGSPAVEIHDLTSMTAYYDNKDLEIVPSVPIQIRGKKAGYPNPNGDLRKIIEWFLEKRIGIPLRNPKVGEEGIWDLLEKEDKENDSNAHNKQVDYAFNICALQPHDPYLLKRCGRIPTEEVENFPLKVIKRAKPYPPGNRKTATHWDIECGPATKPGSIAWWAKKNKFRRKRFAKLFYQIMEHYGNGVTTVNMNGMPNTLDIVQSPPKIITGTFTTLTGEQSVVGSYWFELIGQKITIRKQISDTEYKEIDVTTITQTLSIDGEYFRLKMDGSWRSSADEDNSGGAGELYPQLWIPWDVYDRSDFTSNIIIKEYGIKFLFFTKVVIKTNWIWTIIAVIVTIIVCVYSVGIACPGAITALGTFLGVNIVVAVIIYYAAMVLIQMALKELLSNIDSPWLRAIIMIVVVVVMAMAGDFNQALSNTTTMLTLAASVTTILYNAYYEIEMTKLVEEQARRDKNEDINNQIDMANSGSGLWQVSLEAHYSQNRANSADAQYSQMEGLTNFDQFYDVSGAINFRINVVPG